MRFPHLVRSKDGDYQMPRTLGTILNKDGTPKLDRNGNPITKNCWLEHRYPSGKVVGGLTKNGRRCRNTFRPADYKGGAARNAGWGV